MVQLEIIRNKIEEKINYCRKESKDAFSFEEGDKWDHALDVLEELYSDLSDYLYLD